MGNDTENPYRTILAQAVKIGEMILNDGRDIHQLIRYLQPVIARKDFITILDAPQAVRQVVQEVKEDLLQLDGTISVPSMTALGKMRDVFKVDTSDSARVKISYVGSNVYEWFNEMYVLAFAGSMVCWQTLMRNAYDRAVVQALGGERKEETSLSEMYWLMKQQPDGRDGILLTDGKANIFYVCGRKGILRVVHVHWDARGWSVYADEIGNAPRASSSRVFSHAHC
ncbi:MAG: hypothetical protein V1902_00360 [Candidatus Falkowbacteria bacterium]